MSRSNNNGSKNPIPNELEVQNLVSKIFFYTFANKNPEIIDRNPDLFNNKRKYKITKVARAAFEILDHTDVKGHKTGVSGWSNMDKITKENRGKIYPIYAKVPILTVAYSINMIALSILSPAIVPWGIYASTQDLKNALKSKVKSREDRRLIESEIEKFTSLVTELSQEKRTELATILERTVKEISIDNRPIKPSVPADKIKRKDKQSIFVIGEAIDKARSEEIANMIQQKNHSVVTKNQMSLPVQINLVSNTITEDAFKIILESIKNSGRLTKLHLNSNNLSENQVDLLLQYTKECANLIPLLEMVNANQSQRDGLASATRDNYMMSTVLQNGLERNADNIMDKSVFRNSAAIYPWDNTSKRCKQFLSTKTNSEKKKLFDKCNDAIERFNENSLSNFNNNSILKKMDQKLGLTAIKVGGSRLSGKHHTSWLTFKVDSPEIQRLVDNNVQSNAKLPCDVSRNLDGSWQVNVKRSQLKNFLGNFFDGFENLRNKDIYSQMKREARGFNPLQQEDFMETKHEQQAVNLSHFESKQQNMEAESSSVNKESKSTQQQPKNKGKSSEINEQEEDKLKSDKPKKEKRKKKKKKDNRISPNPNQELKETRKNISEQDQSNPIDKVVLGSQSGNGSSIEEQPLIKRRAKLPPISRRDSPSPSPKSAQLHDKQIGSRGSREVEQGR